MAADLPAITVHLPIRIGVVAVTGMTISGDPGAFAELERCAASYRERHGATPISEVPEVGVARRLFRALGIEPTKHRPASEALLRRALKDKGFHAVNTAVDVANWCSLDFLRPICAYDLAKVEGDIAIRPGREDEEYEGINRRMVHLAGRYALVDDRGPFGSPITDSLRTAIGTETASGLFLMFGPADDDADLLRRRTAEMGARLERFCGGTAGEVRVLTGTG